MRKISLGASPIPPTPSGPQIRPLDYASLITHESTHTELARTIEDLTQWLSIVEVGLGGMLDLSYTDTIEEEQEVPSDLEDGETASRRLESSTASDLYFK